MKTDNLFHNIPQQLPNELFETLVESDTVTIERIVSCGHSSPESGWYDQDQNEWVLVIQGAAVLEFEEGPSLELNAGDHCNLPAHCKHKVAWTDSEQQTIWLAVFYS